MKPSKHVGPSSRVFIAGWHHFEIVYVPATGQIVSLFAGEPAADGVRKAIQAAGTSGAAPGTAGTDATGDDEE